MAEWLYEEGIGEDRAILVEDGAILEAAIELPGALRTGAVVEARLISVVIPGRRGIASTDLGELLVEPLPVRLTEGAAFRAEIVREAVPEAGRHKRAIARAIDEDVRTAPSLADRISGNPLPIHGDDAFEAHGWTELLEEAATGEIAFPGGALRMSLTPAMTLFDVDGALSPGELAVTGADAAARAIRRLGIAGSIGIDLPTVADKAVRQQAAAAIDAVLPQPFERTAVNGFGFVQIVRRRERPSLPEIVQGDPVGAAARALLRRAQRQRAPLALIAAPSLVTHIERHPAWLEALARQAGGGVTLRPDPALAISAGYVHARQD